MIKVFLITTQLLFKLD